MPDDLLYQSDEEDRKRDLSATASADDKVALNVLFVARGKLTCVKAKIRYTSFPLTSP